MKILPIIGGIIDGGLFVGNRRAHGRVTVEQGWQLNETAATVGLSTRGPYRYFQTAANAQTEVEVPNIRTITIQRSLESDAAQCTIAMRNHTLAVQELPGQLGTPGYYWFDHGYPLGSDAVTEWQQDAGVWQTSHPIEVNALLRTYQGYGGFEEDGSPMSIADALSGGYITLTGVWLVDRLNAGSDGMITMTCRDMAKLLIDQKLYPPLVPPAYYPVEYWAANSAYGSPYEPPSPDAEPSLVVTNITRSVPTACVSIANHPVAGYWVVDQQNNVYPTTAEDPWGQAYNYGGGPGDLSDPSRAIVAIASTLSGNGYWTMEDDGTVHSYGDAVDYGSWNTGYAAIFHNAIDIVPTYTGNGYWCIRRSGYVSCHGDAPELNGHGDQTQWVAKSDIMAALEAFGWWQTFNDHFTATGACGHPTGYGLWTVSGNGEINAFGVANDFGQVLRREGLKHHEWPHGIAATATGNGYWIAFGSGKVVPFGDAADLGGAEMSEIELGPTESGFFYTKLVLDIARSPDSRGFYVVRADGSVLEREAAFWRSAGSADAGTVGDWSDVVKEILLWGGFHLKSEPDLSGVTAEVFGAIETIGIDIADAKKLGSDKFDKMALIDVIKQIREVVAYVTFVDSQGGFHFVSPNRWEYGNWLSDGTRDTDNIITLEDTKTLTGYSVNIDSSALRSQIIVGTREPDPDNPADTVIEYYTPPTAAKLKGMIIPAIWPDELFTNRNEVRLMTQLIGASIWFSQREANITCPADPRIEIDDQVVVKERITSDNYCVDTDTEILTRRGWLTHDEVKIGDYALSLNVESGKSEWKEIKDLFVRHVVDETMLHLEGKRHSSLTTMDHRWPVVDAPWKKRKDYVKDAIHWTTSGELRRTDGVLRSAPCDDLPDVPTYSNEFVEMIAWYITEGCCSVQSDDARGRVWRQSCITQSRTKNFANCERIVKCLKAVAGGDWRETTDKNGTSRFYVGVMTDQKIQEVAPGDTKAISPEFLLSLTMPQLNLFIDVCMKGDGHFKSTCHQFGQNLGPVLDGFQMAATLAGIPYTVKNGEGDHRLVNMSKEPVTYPLVSNGANGKKIEEVLYSGKIWCPMLSENYSWFARRNGTVYFTGNCYYVNSVNTSMDLDSGVYSMDVSGHWLGKPDYWAFTSATPGPEQLQYSGDVAAHLAARVRTTTGF